ncbi:MAG: hypothetical protein IJK71_12980 [Clostridia bacterium]|nr:hypothetical protein [Oscillospiraceae bacterium]MBQ6290143.1 hypothetical protein [Clostridia bacterium]
MQYMKVELARGLRAPKFLLAILICLGIYILGEGYQGWISIILHPSTTWIHRHNGFMMEFNPFRSLLPFPAVLAAGSMLVEDWEHHSLYFQSTRCSFNTYCNVKFFTPCIIGGIVLTIGVLCYLGTMAFSVPAYNDGTYYEPFMEPIILNHQWGLYFLYFASLQFLLGAVCAGMGCIIATLTVRRGMIYLFPMLFFSMLEIATKITIVGLSGAQSSIVFRLETDSPGLVYCVIAGILLAFILVSYILFRTLFRKRVIEWQ